VAPSRFRKSGRVSTIGNVEANPKGYNFPVHVTKGHEAEAKAALRRQRPSRIAKFMLKLLGFRGEVGTEYIDGD